MREAGVPAGNDGAARVPDRLDIPAGRATGGEREDAPERYEPVLTDGERLELRRAWLADIRLSAEATAGCWRPSRDRHGRSRGVRDDVLTTAFRSRRPRR